MIINTIRKEQRKIKRFLHKKDTPEGVFSYVVFTVRLFCNDFTLHNTEVTRKTTDKRVNTFL